MAKVWVSGHTRADGTKVKGYWKEVKKLSMSAVKERREKKQEAKVRAHGPMANVGKRAKGARKNFRQYKTGTAKSWRQGIG